MNFTPETPGDVAAPCPRCKKPLIDPQGLGWCKACGYCHSLAESEKTPTPATSTPNQISATGAAIGQTPAWAWITLIGLAVIVGATFAGGRYLTLTPLHRALFTTCQTLAGVAIMFIGQFLALLKIAPEDSTLSFKDAVFPFRLYGLIFKRLPATSFAIYFGVWGLSAIIAANVFIGGLPHWITYLPGQVNNPASKTKAAK